MTTTHITNIIDWLNQYNLATTWTALAEKELNDLLAERTALTDEVADLKKKLESAEHNLQLSVQGEIAANNTNQILEEDVKKQDAELIGLHGEKEALKQRCQWAENELSEANGTAAFQTERANDMAAQRDSWIERAAKAKSEINNLKYSKLSAIENLGNAEKRMMEAEKHEAELQKIREAQSKRIAELESENANLRSVIDSEKQSYQATIERATRERDTAFQNQNAYYRNYTEQLELREKAESCVEELEEDVAHTRAAHDDLVARLHACTKPTTLADHILAVAEACKGTRYWIDIGVGVKEWTTCRIHEADSFEVRWNLSPDEAATLLQPTAAQTPVDTMLRDSDSCETPAHGDGHDRMNCFNAVCPICRPRHPVFREDAFNADADKEEADKAVLTEPVSEIPVQTNGPAYVASSPAQMRPVMPAEATRFLAYQLPGIMACGNDWQEYHRMLNVFCCRLARDVYAEEVKT